MRVLVTSQTQSRHGACGGLVSSCSLGGSVEQVFFDLAQRLAFDLADALTGKIDLRPNLLEGHGWWW